MKWDTREIVIAPLNSSGISQHRLIYFKEWAHTSVRCLTSPIHIQRQSLVNHEEPMLQVKSEGHLLAEFPLAPRRSTFDSLLPFTWLDEAHPHYRGQPPLFRVLSTHFPDSWTRNSYFSQIPPSFFSARPFAHWKTLHSAEWKSSPRDAHSSCPSDPLSFTELCPSCFCWPRHPADIYAHFKAICLTLHTVLPPTAFSPFRGY